MKAIVCEMCGSHDLVKSEGFYICQNCNTKYSVEEAKKLMVEIEGTVDVSGSTVKVDNTSFVQKSLENARRAKDKEDWEECEKYYNMVEQHEPQNLEAIFYSSYGKAKMAMVEADRFKREQKMNVLKKSISIIDDNYDTSPEKYAENKELITQINNDLFKLIGGSYVVNARKNVSTGVTISDDRAYTVAMFENLVIAWIESLHNIEKKISEPQKLAYIWKILRQNYLYIYNVTNSRENAEKSALKIEKIDRDINSVYSDYHGQQLPPSKWEQAEENKRRLKKNLLIALVVTLILGAIIFSVYIQGLTSEL